MLLGGSKVAVVTVIVIGSGTAGLRKFTTESRKTILGFRDFLCPRILITLQIFLESRFLPKSKSSTWLTGNVRILGINPLRGKYDESHKKLNFERL